MKPLNLIALILFIGGATWALTRSDNAVRKIQSSYYSILLPFLKSGTATENYLRSFTREIKHTDELEAELTITRIELDRLRQIEQRFESVQADNARIRAALDFKKNTPFKVVAAPITRRRTTTWFETAEINRGDESNIGNQNPVVTAEGLVGKIDLTKKEFATIILLTDEKCQVAAKVENSPEVGIVSGKRSQYGDTPFLQLKFLSKNANLKSGQRVFSSGRGGIFPSNLLIGTIESVEPGAIASEALVKPAVNFSDLDTVFVIPKQ
jgi:rod shape-determining protein MreC